VTNLTNPALTPEESAVTNTSKLRDAHIAFLIGFGVFLIYLKTLCPTIYTDDCGEITTAVATGGVMHPPGYPLYSLVGWLFVHLIPLGEPAWRLGILSGLAAAVSVALTFTLCRRLGAGRLWSACGALAFAFSYTLWQQATKVETYALNAAFVAMLLNHAILYSQTGRRALLLSMAAIGGLALTNHLTILWLVPAVLWIALPTLFAVESRPWRGLAAATGICFAMLTLYGYEILAARTHPGGQVWGDPSNWTRFYLQITGARYHDYFSNLSAVQMAYRDFVFVPSWLWRNLGCACALSLAGLVVLWRGAGKRFAQGLLIALTGYLICNTIYGIDNIFEYYTPIVLILATLAAVGTDRAALWLTSKSTPDGQRRLQALFATCALVGLIGVPFGLNWRLCDRSHQLFVRTLAQDTLSPLPQNAVLVVSGDNRIFPLWYLQDVLGIRRDVLILPRDLLWNLDTEDGRQTDLWYFKKLAAREPGIDPQALLQQCRIDRNYAQSDGPIWQIAREDLQKGRPLYISEVSPGDLRANGAGPDVFAWIHLPVSPIPEGLTYRLVDAQRVPPTSEMLTENVSLEARFHIAYIDPQIMVGEPDGPFSDAVYARYLTQIGKMLIAEKRFPDAYTQLAAARSLDASSAEAEDSYATASLALGKTAEAVKAWQNAVALDPESPVYRSHLQAALSEVAQARPTR
jgi:hypothetical protein